MKGQVMTRSNKQKIWSIIMVGGMLGLVILQFITGAAEFNSSIISSIITVALAISITNYIKKRRQKEIVKDERYLEINRHANSTTFAYFLIFEIFGYGLAWALSPYWPALKTVAFTLLILVVVQAIAVRFVAAFYDQKKS